MILNKCLFLALFFISTWSFAQEKSAVIPQFFEAIDSYKEDAKGGPFSATVLSIHEIFRKHGLKAEFLNRFRNNTKTEFYLAADDYAQTLIENSVNHPLKNFWDLSPISFHAFRVDVLEASDDWFKDDIYFYFFVTDGVIPTGKVTSIYKGLSSGESFFLDEKDRALFPLAGIAAKTPNKHLIVDYGMVESDGDDIKEMQKLSSVIIDIAIAVYAVYDPTNAQILINLRKEVKALADMLIEMNNDDRLVTDTLALTNDDLAKLLDGRSFVEIKREYKNNADFDTWKYRLHFRILKE